MLYIVTMNFDYELNKDSLILYFHAAKECLKIDILKNNSNVCFEMDPNHKLVRADLALNFGFKYESIIGNSVARFIDNEDEKINPISKIWKSLDMKMSLNLILMIFLQKGVN